MGLDDDAEGNRPEAAADRPAGAPVVRLTDLDPRNPSRMVAELRAYWDSLRRGRAIPARTDIEPRGIRRALDHAFILERIAPGAARFRLAGRHLVDLMGMEVRGMPLCAFFNPGARGNLSDLLETVFRGPQILDLTVASAGDYGRPALGGRMVILPLRSDLGDVSRALGGLIAEGEIGRAPRRFDILSHEVHPVIAGARTLAPSPSAEGFADPAASWTAPPEAAPRPAAPTPASPTARLATPEERRASFRVISRD